MAERYWPLLTPEYDLGCRVSAFHRRNPSLLTPGQRRILDNKYIKTLHNTKMLLTRDTIASVRPHCLVGTSGQEYPADFLVRKPNPHPQRFEI
jgi:hypothetical protein